MSYHMCVWIDHREARVFSIGMDDADMTVVTDNGPVHHIHRKADHVRLGTVPTDPEFLGEVAKALAPAKAILICGPGKARTELAGHLNDHTPAIAKRVWASSRWTTQPIARSSPPREHTSAPRIACMFDRT